MHSRAFNNRKRVRPVRSSSTNLVIGLLVVVEPDALLAAVARQLVRRLLKRSVTFEVHVISVGDSEGTDDAAAVNALQRGADGSRPVAVHVHRPPPVSTTSTSVTTMAKRVMSALQSLPRIRGPINDVAIVGSNNGCLNTAMDSLATWMCSRLASCPLSRFDARITVSVGCDQSIDGLALATQLAQPFDRVARTLRPMTKWLGIDDFSSAHARRVSSPFFTTREGVIDRSKTRRASSESANSTFLLDQIEYLRPAIDDVKEPSVVIARLPCRADIRISTFPSSSTLAVVLPLQVQSQRPTLRLYIPDSPFLLPRCQPNPFEPCHNSPSTPRAPIPPLESRPTSTMVAPLISPLRLPLSIEYVPPVKPTRPVRLRPIVVFPSTPTKRSTAPPKLDPIKTSKISPTLLSNCEDVEHEEVNWRRVEEYKKITLPLWNNLATHSLNHNVQTIDDDDDDDDDSPSVYSMASRTVSHKPQQTIDDDDDDDDDSPSVYSMASRTASHKPQQPIGGSSPTMTSLETSIISQLLTMRRQQTEQSLQRSGLNPDTSRLLLRSSSYSSSSSISTTIDGRETEF